MSNNPYRQPQGAPHAAPFNRAAVESKLKVPGVALIVVGSIGMLLMGGYGIINLIAVLSGALPPPPPEMQGVELQSYHVGVYGAVIMIPLNALLQILVIFGGIAVVRAKGRGMAMTGAVLSVIPCLSSSLCMLGIPFGIWSLIVLSDSNVKQLFR